MANRKYDDKGLPVKQGQPAPAVPPDAARVTPKQQDPKAAEAIANLFKGPQLGEDQQALAARFDPAHNEAELDAAIAAEAARVAKKFPAMRASVTAADKAEPFPPDAGPLDRPHVGAKSTGPSGPTGGATADGGPQPLGQGATHAHIAAPAGPRAAWEELVDAGTCSDLDSGTAWLKAGALGFAASGKTFTMTELAIGAWHYFGLKTPIGFFDTESGSTYVAARVRQATGLPLLGRRGRSLDNLLLMARKLLESGVRMLIVDSVTHIWRKLCDDYLAEMNVVRERRNLSPLQKLEFQHWGPIKQRWAAWADFYTNSPMHILVCGAGYDYDFEKSEETGRRELIKTGVKMKTEGEFGFEPSLLIELEQMQEMQGDRPRIWHRGLVLKDRFNRMNGVSIDFDPAAVKRDPSMIFNAFLPHISQLRPGTTSAVDVDTATDFGINEQLQDNWQHESRTRTILSEEISGELSRVFPSTQGKDKVRRNELLFEAFGTRSWTAVEAMQSSKLRSGLEFLRGKLADLPTAGAPAEEFSQ